MKTITYHTLPLRERSLVALLSLALAGLVAAGNVALADHYASAQPSAPVQSDIASTSAAPLRQASAE